MVLAKDLQLVGTEAAALTPVTFDIVIPTKNEEGDIDATLLAALAQSYPASRILVVDDSHDATPERVRRIASQSPSIELVQGSGSGRCAARNYGIELSTAEVIVLLNADVRLPDNFLARLAEHYRGDVDYVLVGWDASNDEEARARFVIAQSHRAYASDSSIEWTEGFSCRRSVLLKIGLFPITPLPLVAGEDGVLGERLSHTARKCVDRNLVVRFVVPVRLRDFWRTYKERSYPFVHFFVHGRSLPAITAWICLKASGRLLYFAALVPWLWNAWVLSRLSAGGVRDLPAFLLTDLLQRAAFSAGEIEGLAKLLAFRRQHVAKSG